MTDTVTRKHNTFRGKHGHSHGLTRTSQSQPHERDGREKMSTRKQHATTHPRASKVFSIPKKRIHCTEADAPECVVQEDVDVRHDNVTNR